MSNFYFLHACMLILAEDSAFEKARKALREFNVAVAREMTREDILDKIAAIYSVWDQTREAIKDMKTTARADKWYQWGMSMVVLGTLAISLTGFPGLLSLFGAGVALDKIIKPRPSIAGIGSLPAAIYELEQVLEKVKDKT